MLFCDAHFHAACCRELEKEPSSYGIDGENSYYGASCAHFIEEFARQKDIVGQNGGHILLFFGMHPQLPLLGNADFMESLLQRKEIRGIGETGFDLFTEEFKANIQAQEEAWQTSLALAAAYSDCPSGKQAGGSLGWFGRGAMVPEFDHAVFSMKDGEVSDVVETQFGYHIIKKVAHLEAECPTFEEARDKIRDFLRHAARGEALNAYVEELREKATIEE